jgi:endonuclease-8
MEEAMRRLTAKPGRPVGEALLDQRNLAGIGNMYKAEACFLFGVHPATPVGDVTRLRDLVDRCRQLLDINKTRAQQSTTGDLRRGRELWVYGRRGQPCRRCGTAIRREVFAAMGDRDRRQSPDRGPDQDQARESFWCPICQPLPRTVP